MLFINVVSVVACLAGLASGLRLGTETSTSVDIRRHPRDVFVFQRGLEGLAGLDQKLKECPRKVPKASDEHHVGRRSVEGVTSTDELIGNVEYVWMGEHILVPTTRTISVAGVNGCTAAFFFGNGHVLGAHLSAGTEVAEANTAALAAVAAGTITTVVVRAPDEATLTAVHNAIAAHIAAGHITATEYPYRSGNHDCWQFKVASGTTSVAESWSKQ